MTDSVHAKPLHMFEILKIVEGALAADREQVRAYTEQLASKLEKDGEGTIATRFRKALAGVRAQEIQPRRVGGARMPVDSEARFALADERSFGVAEVPVELAPATKQRIDEFVRFAGASDAFVRHGVGLAPTMLLAGPPGVGKTEIARHIAARLELPLLTARSDALISSFLGATSKNLRALFEHAAMKPCVLFLDEFDGLAKVRDDQHELGELKRVVVSVLQNIDALEQKTILIAATNHAHLLDPAVGRRFSFRVDVPPPDLATRERLWRRFLGHFAGDVALDRVAALSDGMTGADIRSTAENAVREAILAPRDDVGEVMLYRRVIAHRFPDLTSRGELTEQLKVLRELAPKVFTYRRLAEFFDVSTGNVHKLMNAEGADDGE